MGCSHRSCPRGGLLPQDDLDQQCQDRAQECRQRLAQRVLLPCSPLLCHRRRKYLHLSSPSQAQLPTLSRKSSCPSCPSSNQRVPPQLPRPLMLPLLPHQHLRTKVGRKPQGRVSIGFTHVGFVAGQGGDGAGISRSWHRCWHQAVCQGLRELCDTREVLQSHL